MTGEIEGGAVPRHIEVEDLPPVGIPGQILDELRAHARETFPEECCGLILGNDRQRYAYRVPCRNDMNQRHREDPVHFPRDARAAFWMNEMDQVDVQKRAEAKGDRVTAVYHSHVRTGVYLSEMDLEYATSELFPYPDADQIVVAVHAPDARGLVGIFTRETPSAPFRGRPVEPTAP